MNFFKKNNFFYGVLVSLLLLLFYSLIVFKGSIPYISVNSNIYKSYRSHFIDDLNEYLLNVEKLVKNISESDVFIKKVNAVLNSSQNILKDEAFIHAPLKYISFEKNNDLVRKGFFLKNNDLIFNVRYSNSYFSVNTINFVFDFKTIIEEVSQRYSTKFSVYIGNNSKVFFKEKDLSLKKTLIKKIDHFFLTYSKNDQFFYLQDSDLTVYIDSIPPIDGYLLFIYRDGYFSLSIVSLFIFIVLSLMLTVFLSLMFKKLFQEKIPIISHRKVNNEIVDLLNDIGGGKKNKSLLDVKERLKIIENALKEGWESGDDFLNFLEKQFHESIKAFVFEKNIEKNTFIFSFKRGFISNNFNQFSFDDGMDIIDLLKENNILSITNEEFKNSFINDYLDTWDKENTKQLFFLPIFSEGQFKNIIVLGF